MAIVRWSPSRDLMQIRLPIGLSAAQARARTRQADPGAASDDLHPSISRVTRFTPRSCISSSFPPLASSWVITEDNYGAGIGSAVADVLSEHGGAFTLTQMYVRQIPKSGRTPDDVLRYLGLSAQDIMKTAVEMLAMAAG